MNPMNHNNESKLSIPLLGIAQICSWGTLFYSFPQLALALEQDLAWSKSNIYVAVTLGMLLSAVASIPIGAAIDRGHGRNIMTYGSIFAGLILIMSSQINELIWFYVLFAGMGVVQAATLYEAMFAIIAKEHDKQATKKNITTITLWGGFASTLFIPLMEFILNMTDWRTLLIVLGLINITVCAAIYSRLPRQIKQTTVTAKQSKKANSLENVKWALQQPIFWSLLSCFALFAALMTAFRFHMYPIFFETGLSAQEVVTLIAVIGPSQVLGRLFMMFYGDKLRINTLGVATAAVLPIVFLAFVYLPADALILVPFAMLFGAASGLMTIVKGVAVPELLTENSYGVINGLMNLPIKLLKAFAPTLAALLWAMTHDYSLLMSLFVIGGFVVLLAFSLSALLTQKSPADNELDCAKP